MKVYKVKVNGKVYEVELESVTESNATIATPTKAPTVEKVAPAPVAQTASTNGGAKLNAPMAGTILDVKVKVGDSVNVGDVVCILEAMKLENEVVADCAGVIQSIAVSKGDTVQNGQLLVVIG